MKKNRCVLILMCICFVLTVAFYSYAQEEKLSEEQMTAYRTRPAVVLIYSGMYVEIALKSGQTSKIPHYGSGSGFFIHPEGYLVTNGHVVASFVEYSNDRDGYANKVANNYIVNVIIEELKQRNGRQPTEAEVQQAYNQFVNAQSPRVVGHGGINYVLLSNGEDQRFEVKKYSPSIPEGGKDIAVLKIERDNCPVLMLGDSSQLVLQQKVFTIGFPGLVDPQQFPILGQNNTREASITGGAISALKTDYKGMSVIQHDAAASHGNSGGPMVDVKGRVIGVLSYGASQSFLFSVPVNSAKEFIRDTGIEVNRVSEFTTVYNALLDSVWEKRWYDARTHVTTAIAYMKNQPDLEKLQQLILRHISEMGFFQKIWMQNKIIVLIAIVLVVLILFVLKLALFPSSSRTTADKSPVASTVSVGPAPAPILAEKTKAVSEGTVVEGDVAGSVTVLVKGQEKGTFNITADGVVVGRDPASSDVHIPFDIVSKTHLKIFPRGDKFYLKDLGSTNGTFVNGEKIKETLVTLDDSVQLGKKGEVKLVFKK